ADKSKRSRARPASATASACAALSCASTAPRRRRCGEPCGTLDGTRAASDDERITAQDAQKTIFVTGAGSGIGRATAQLFAQRGWFVGLFDVNQKGLDETSAMLPEGQRMSMTFDVRDRN